MISKKYLNAVTGFKLYQIGKLRHDANIILRFYKVGCQIEFLFRDARQFLELNHCQARRSKTRYFYFNAFMTALNPIKLEDRIQHTSGVAKIISIASWKIHKSNKIMLLCLGLDCNFIKSRLGFHTFCHYAAIVA